MPKSIWKQKRQWDLGGAPQRTPGASARSGGPGASGGLGLPSLIDKGVGYVTGLGKRIMIHFAGLITGAILQSTVDFPPGAPFFASGSVIICTYLGIICLFPASMGKREDWFIPTIAGLALCLVWPFFGVPWQFTLLWGGLTTWLTRFAARKGQMGWEWSAVPWLLISLYLFMSDLRPMYPASTPYWTLPLFVAGGWAGLKMYARVRFDSIHRGMLEDGFKSMNALLEAKTIAPQLEPPVRRLANQGARLLALSPRFDSESAAMVLEYSDAATWLQDRAKLPPAAIPAQAMREAVDQLDGLSRRFTQRLDVLEPKPKTTDPLALRISEFTKSADSLVGKSGSLPQDLQDRIRGIRAATDNIVGCMQDDPTDVPQADKFLSRYLKAAHSVVDEYTRLAPQSASHAHIADALERSREVLGRLEKAFEHEHNELLQNDTMNLTAELNVLDKLLKMDGK